jgi:aspartyl-tRNA(Asn)/glutamyl-tRNA(Gln) amidotransferase subunit B
VHTGTPAHSDYYVGFARQADDPKAAANWVRGSVLASLNATGGDLSTFKIRPADLAQLIKLVKDGALSNSAAKTVFAEMATTGDRPEQIAQRLGVLQVRDEGELEKWVNDVLAEHPDESKRFLSGEKKLQGVLVGFVMKKSGGRADPKRVNQLLSTRAAG